MFRRRPLKTRFKVPFTTQSDLLFKYGGEDLFGLCQALSNLYARYLISGNEPSFLQNDEETYEKAVIEENHQLTLEHGEHSAFIDTDTEHEDIEVQALMLTNAEELEKILGKAEHSLITYPTPNPNKKNSAHQIYFGRNKNSCRFFDADKLGGEIKGECSKVLKYVSQSIESNLAHDGRTAYIGKSV